MDTIKHVVWDWNGTLLDDIDVSMDALNTILKKKSCLWYWIRQSIGNIFSFRLSNIIRRLALILIKRRFLY